MLFSKKLGQKPKAVHSRRQRICHSLLIFVCIMIPLNDCTFNAMLQHMESTWWFHTELAVTIGGRSLELPRCDMQFRSTSKHSNCDALSRLPLFQTIADDDNEVHALHFEVIDTAITSKRVRIVTARDKILSQVFTFVSDGWPELVSDDLKPYFIHKNQMTIVQDCLLWRRRVMIPHALSSRILQELHEPHLSIVRTKSLARCFVWWLNIDENVENICSIANW